MELIMMFALVIGLVLGTQGRAFAAEEIPIWPGDAPGTTGRPNEEEMVNERVQKVHQPSLTVHLPPRELATGTAVLICPGGAYHHVTFYKEGHHIASWLNTLGVAAFVLKYRLDRAEALQDAQQAMRLIRSRAKDWGVNPDRVGAMGFSAGGHLILNVTLNSDAGNPEATDAVARMSCRPDFLVPVYPAIGKLDIENGLTAQSPPAFLVGATDDTGTPPENAIRVYRSLVKAGVRAELHLYERGGHGFGLGKTKGPIASWTEQCAAWMRIHEWLTVAQ